MTAKPHICREILHVHKAGPNAAADHPANMALFKDAFFYVGSGTVAFVAGVTINFPFLVGRGMAFVTGVLAAYLLRNWW